MITPTYKISSFIESITINKYEVIDNLYRELELLKHFIEKVDIAVNSLNYLEKRIIRLYYLGEERLTFKQLSKIIHKEEGHIKRYIMPKALRKIHKQLVDTGIDLERLVNKKEKREENHSSQLRDKKS